MEKFVPYNEKKWKQIEIKCLTNTGERGIIAYNNNMGWYINLIASYEEGGKNMKLRRFLAALLLLSMIVSIVPTSVFAVDTNDGSNNVSSGETTATAVGSVVAPKDNLFLSNIAKLEADGTYTINLSAYATAERITQSLESGYPLDVVLVISQTGTLHENGKNMTALPWQR